MLGPTEVVGPESGSSRPREAPGGSPRPRWVDGRFLHRAEPRTPPLRIIRAPGKLPGRQRARQVAGLWPWAAGGSLNGRVRTARFERSVQTAAELNGEAQTVGLKLEYGNDSRQNGPLSSRFLHNGASVMPSADEAAMSRHSRTFGEVIGDRSYRHNCQ
jgi:hypothetical protein